MKITVKRITALERRLHPLPEGGPLTVLYHHVPGSGMTPEAFTASMKDLDEKMIAAAAGTGKAGEPVSPVKTSAQEEAAYQSHLKNPDPGPVLVVEVVHVDHNGGSL